MDELYENIITLNKNISVDTFSITNPKTSSSDLSTIISFIDSLSKNLDTLVMHIKTENDILLVKSISDKLDDFISKSQTYSRNDLQQVIQPNLHEHCYLFIMNCAQNLKFYEKMALKKLVNNAIFDVNDSINNKLHPFQNMITYKPLSINNDDESLLTSKNSMIYDVSVKNKKFNESETFMIEYNMGPLINFREVEKYGPITKWNNGISTDIIKRYKNIAVNSISNEWDNKLKSAPAKSDQCVSKLFFVKQNGSIRKYNTQGKDTKPFEGLSNVTSNYCDSICDLTLNSNGVVSYNLELELPEGEGEHAIGKGSYLNIIDEVSSIIRKRITETIPLTFEDFMTVCTDRLLIFPKIHSIFYNFYSNYLGKSADKYQTELTLCVFESSNKLTNSMIKKTFASIQPYISANIFLEGPSQRIESLMYAYDIGMNSVLKDHKETIHENLILLKKLYI